MIVFAKASKVMPHIKLSGIVIQYHKVVSYKFVSMHGAITARTSDGLKHTFGETPEPEPKTKEATVGYRQAKRKVVIAPYLQEVSISEIFGKLVWLYP